MRSSAGVSADNFLLMNLKCLCIAAAFALWICAATVLAQEASPAPRRALPAQLNSGIQNLIPPAPLAPPIEPQQTGIALPHLAMPPVANELTNGVLAFDRELQEATVSLGAPEAKFIFGVTNVCADTVKILGVGTSCGCTVAQLPPLPWELKPKDSGAIPVTMNLAGKSGLVFKTVTVNTDRGQKTLMVKVDIQAPAQQQAAAAAQ